MTLTVTIKSDDTASRAVDPGNANDDWLVPVAEDYTLVLYNPTATSVVGKVMRHPSGGGGTLSSESTIYGANPSSGGGPLAAGALDASTCAWLRWKNDAAGWRVTIFAVTSSGIGTVGSEQSVFTNLAFKSGSSGAMLPLDAANAGVICTTSDGGMWAGRYTWSGTTVSFSSDLVQVLSAANCDTVVSANIIDATHMLVFWWISDVLKCGVVTFGAGSTITISAATTVLAAGYTNGGSPLAAGVGTGTLDGGGLFRMNDGSFLAAVPAVHAGTTYWDLFVVTMSGATVAGVTADPQNDVGTGAIPPPGSFDMRVRNGSWPFVLNGGTFYGITRDGTSDPTKSDVQMLCTLDGNHHLDVSLGGELSLLPFHRRGPMRSFDSAARVVAFGGTDATADTVRAFEYVLDDLAALLGGWLTGTVGFGA